MNIILPRDEKKANVRDVIYGPAALLNPDCHLKRWPVVFRCTAWSAISFENIKSEFLFNKFAKGIIIDEG